MTTELTTVSDVERALNVAIESGSVPAVRDARALGEALRAAARTRGLGLDAENRATVLVLNAEREIGKLLNAMEAEGRLAPRAGNNPLQLPTLGELGLDDRYVYVWRRAARIPDDEWQSAIDFYAAKGKRLAKVDVYKHRSFKPEITPEQAAAQRDVIAALTEGADPRTFREWEEASRAMMSGDQLPLDVMVRVAEIINELVAWYQSRRGG